MPVELFVLWFALSPLVGFDWPTLLDVGVLRYADSVTGLDAAWAESCGNLQLPMDVPCVFVDEWGRAWGG